MPLQRHATCFRVKKSAARNSLFPETSGINCPDFRKASSALETGFYCRMMRCWTIFGRCSCATAFILKNRSNPATSRWRWRPAPARPTFTCGRYSNSTVDTGSRNSPSSCRPWQSKKALTSRWTSWGRTCARCIPARRSNTSCTTPRSLGRFGISPRVRRYKSWW